MPEPERERCGMAKLTISDAARVTGVTRMLLYNWLQVLGTTETPHIDQGVRQQFHPVVALLDVLETKQQPFAFVLPRERPPDALP